MNVEEFKKKRIICMAASLLVCVIAGFGYAWSVLQSPIILAHAWPEGGVSLAYTFTVICSTLTSIVFGPLIKKLGTKKCILLGAILFGAGLFLSGIMTSLWQIYIFYSLFTGVGTGFIYPVLMAYVVKLFPDKSGLASGLGTAFYGAGAIIWAPVAASMIEKLSINNTFKILGAAFFVVIFACAFLFMDPSEEIIAALQIEGEKDKPSDSTVLKGLRRGQMVKTGTFYLLVATFALGLTAGMMVISQASPIMQRQYGAEPLVAATFASIFSACNTAGRFAFGTISDRIGIPKAIKIIFIICIVSMFGIAFIPGKVVGIICLGLTAACFGGFASVLTPYTSKIFGPKYITENYGMVYMVFGIAALVGPLIASGFITATGSYTMSFVIAGDLAIVGIILSLFISKSSKKFDF